MPAQPFRLTSLASVLLGASLSFNAVAEPDAKHYHIAPSSLENALNQFGREAGVLISFSSATASGLQSHGLEGNFNPEQGLQTLLEGTGLQARSEGEGAFSLQPAPAANAPQSIELGASSVVGTCEICTRPMLTVVMNGRPFHTN